MTLSSDAVLGSIAQVVAGFILVFMGRRLFWFFVGVVGFVIGFRIGLTLFAETASAFLLAGGIGLIAALLSVVLEKLVIVLTGAAVGWLFFARLAEGIGAGPQISPMLAIGGAVLFAIVSLLVFDVALVVISSLSGTALVLEPFPVAGTLGVILFAAITVIGIVTQLRTKPPD